MGKLITKRGWETVIFLDDTGEMTSRICTKCKELKSASAFGRNKGLAYDKRSDCKACHNVTFRKAISIHNGKHRAKMYGLPSDMTQIVREKIKKQQDNKCILSGETECLTTDHVIPLHWGTGYGDTYGNVVFMSKRLNSSKGKKNIFTWIKGQPDEYQANFHDVLVPMLAARNDMSVEEYEVFVNECYSNRKQ